MAAAGIAVSELIVERGKRRVLDGLSFAVAPGSVYALLGGNGAGKSTTLYALLGLLDRSSGSVSVAGHDPQQAPDAVRGVCAYLAENVALYDHLTAEENVTYFLSLAGQRRTDAERAEAFGAVQLDRSAWGRRVGAFSKGMRQKTAIALALLRQTPVLLLDEPTTGLDPAAASDFHRLLTDLKTRNVAVLMVTHDLLGAADSADAIGLIDNGKLAKEWRDGPGRYDVSELHRAFSGRAAA
jgi:ABC-2 type transport system ATP-binding protein